MTGPAKQSAYLAVADALAREITAAAVWHGERCNWVGAMPEEAPGGRTTLTFRALGADLYGGSAGVGMFLAETAAATGEREYGRTAVGALRHALSRSDDLHPASRLGLYAGLPGIALALVLAGRALEEEAFVDAGRRVIADAARRGPGEELDLVSGSAGAIVGLLALRALLADDALGEAANAHGQALLDRGQRTPSGLSWLSQSFPGAPGLTGFSHGAAGIAVALLELWLVTGDERYREAAEAAFAYERGVYDRRAGNWPDLRHTLGVHDDGGSTFATFWCHGAPGGALARLRALELGCGGELAGEAEAALRTTQAWVSDGVASGAINYSLCHGLAGNAEILLEGAALFPPGAACARHVAMAGIEAYAARGLPWPSGAHGGATPCLFLGSAGIGRFYLRLADPELCSLLLVRPERIAAPSGTAVTS